MRQNQNPIAKLAESSQDFKPPDPSIDHSIPQSLLESRAGAMKRALSARLLRWLASAAIVSAIVYVLQPIPSIGPTTVSMLLLLAVLAIAARWGTSEAAIASVAGGLLFDYFFLPPRGERLQPLFLAVAGRRGQGSP